MPKKNSIREKTLQELRKKLEEVDLAYIPGQPQARSQQIQNDIDDIKANKLNLSVRNWGNQCRKIRENRGYTQKQVAGLMKISHVNIVHQENKKICDVDPFYLEAFSLIYRVSPYSLLGKTKKRLICPIVSTDTDTEKCKNIIMGTLYDPENEDKINALKALTMIGKMKQDEADKVMQIILNTPNMKNVLGINIQEHPKRDEKRWGDLWAWVISNNAKNASATFDLRFCYMEAYLVLQDLEMYNPFLLEVLAKFAVAPPEIRKLMVDIIQIGGFPSSPRALRKYNVEEMVRK